MNTSFARASVITRRLILAALACVGLINGTSAEMVLSGIVQHGTSPLIHGETVGSPIWNTLGNEGSYANIYLVQPNQVYTGPLLNSGNAANASISVPLTPGDYYFYFLVGGFWDNDTGEYGLNLFFDGQTTNPGIAALSKSGEVSAQAVPAGIYTISLNGAPGLTPSPADLVYRAGGLSATLTGYGYGRPGVFGGLAMDRIGTLNSVPDLQSDSVGYFRLRVAALPVITTQPKSQVVNQGTRAAFSVAVQELGSTFQWQKDGVDIPGADGTTFELSAAQPWQIGEYVVVVTSDAGSVQSNPATLGLTGVPSSIWRGLVACYPFDGSAEDLCRPGAPAALVSTTRIMNDPQRGGVVQVTGKGGSVPPFPDELLENQGPGGYIKIPKPALTNGQPFSVTFLIKEEGFSYWHGESFMTMGEGAASVDLIVHYWIGGRDGSPEYYGGNDVAALLYTSDYLIDGAGAVTINLPWTAFTAVSDGSMVALYRNGGFIGNTPLESEIEGDFSIGRHWWENGARYSTRLRARIDDVRIYNRALHSSEVQQLYTLAQTTPPQNTYESWSSAYGLAGDDAELAADPDHDGYLNSAEHCFGTSPASATAALMDAQIQGSKLVLRWLEREGVRYRVAETLDLAPPWPKSQSVPVVAVDQTGVPEGYIRKTVEFPVPVAGQVADTDIAFYRVEAEMGPLIEEGGTVVRLPESGEVVVGQSASLEVTAVGEGISFQWLRNGEPIVGATRAKYVLGSTQITDSGTYSVAVSNPVGLVSSQSVTLAVMEPAGFARVHPGSFVQGSPASEAGRFVDEGPQFTASISKGFYVKESEVTWAEWSAVRERASEFGFTDLGAGRNGNSGDASGTHPVTETSWWDAVKWCNLCSQIEGRPPVYYTAPGFEAADIFKTGTPAVVYPDWSAKGYRLPTESEWEFACRATTTGPTYADLNAAAWYAGNSGGNSHPAGGKQANAWGLRDTIGSAWEWCWDWKAAYTGDAKTDPRGPASGTDRVVRGGSWQDVASTCRAAFRNVGGFPGGRYPFIGFRPVLNVVPSTVAPSIITPPAGKTVLEGQSTILMVTATGGDLTYQWRKNTVPIPGATASEFRMSSTGLGDGGNYSVIITNAAGSTTSSAAAIFVNPVPLSGFARMLQGSFSLGSPPAEAGRADDEGPQSTVTISRPFYLKQTEVTWAEWQGVRELAVAYGYNDLGAGRNGNNGDASGTHPVTEVSWWDAVKWCNLKSQRSGKSPVYYTDPSFSAVNILKSGTPTVYANWSANGYRLPTEAEWEYACRAGTVGAYSGDLNSSAWHYDNSGNNAHPVGQKAANARGFQDMHGNVWEWCWDWKAPYTSDAKTDPSGPASGAGRSYRGGSWGFSAQNCRSANRNNDGPNYSLNDLGFRTALPAD